MVQHAEVEDDVELAQRGEVHGHEVVDDRLNLAVEVLVGHVEALLPRVDAVEEEVAVDPFGVGQESFGRALVVVGLAGRPVQPPHVVVEGHDPCCAAGLGLVGVLAVPGTDIEHGLAPHVGHGAGRREQVLGVGIAVGDQPVAEVHGVEELVGADAFD